MLHELGLALGFLGGPTRLLTSYIFLAGVGTALSALVTWYALPRLWHLLPTDQGREFAVDAEKSIGKPVSGGLIFVPIFVVVALLATPFDIRFLELMGCVLVAMRVGYYDDAAEGGWSEYRLGAIDLGVAVVASMIICQMEDFTIWLPLLKEALVVPPILFVPAASVLIWVSINATNCTDGVDGLSASLTSMAILFLGATLYGIVGHQAIAA